MIKKQINEKFLRAYSNGHLPTNKRKSSVHLQQKMRHMADQSCLKIPFVIVFSHGEKIKNIRIFKRLLSQIGLWFGQGKSKIGKRFPLALIQTAFYLMNQYVPAPVMRYRVPDVEQCFFDVPAFGNNSDVMTPRNLGNLINKVLTH